MDAESLQGLLNDHQIFHSNFQIDHFIIARSGGTLYGMYKQVLRNLHRRYRGLKGLYTQRELLLIEMEEDEVKGQRLEAEAVDNVGPRFGTHKLNELDQRRRAVKLRQKHMALEELDLAIADTEREFRRFYAQAEQMKRKIGTLTPKRRDELDEQMWRHTLKAMAAVDLLTTGRLGNNTITLTMATPKTWRAELLAEIKDNDALIAWFENYEVPRLELPEPKSDETPIRAMLKGEGAKRLKVEG